MPFTLITILELTEGERARNDLLKCFRVGGFQKGANMWELFLVVLFASASRASEVAEDLDNISETVVLASGDMELEELGEGEGYKLTISIGEEKEVFNLQRREERANVWLAEEEGQLFTTKTEVANFS